MHRYWLLVCCFIVFVFPRFVTAQTPPIDGPYIPNPFPPNVEAFTKFPLTAAKIYQSAMESMTKFNDNKEIGQEIAEKYGLGGENWDENQFEEHPWRTNLGRNLGEASADWFMDSAATVLDPLPLGMNFWECAEPRISLDIGLLLQCNLLNCLPFFGDGNFGVVVEYWWPEHHIETNNYAISAFNPMLDSPPRFDLVLPVLTVLKYWVHDPMLLLTLWPKFAVLGGKGMEKFGSWFKVLKDIPKKLRKKPHLGQTHWAGLLPGDQTLYQEAHTYRTLLAVEVAAKAEDVPKHRGFLEDAPNDCQYLDFLGEKVENRKIVNGWTEAMPFHLFWKIPELSVFLDEQLYLASVPLLLLLENAVVGTPIDQILDFARFAGPCASYRLSKWPQQYGDLAVALKIVPGNPNDKNLEKICYKGGGELFPIVGNLMGHFAPLTAEAYLARRAIYLFSSKKKFFDTKLNSDETRLPGYDDDVDKMQRVYPRVGDRIAAPGFFGTSKCFRANDIPNYGEDVANFPPDLVREEDMGSIRHTYWNKRIACHCTYWGIQQGCYTMEYGDEEDDRIRPGLPVWMAGMLGYPAHGIFWPFIF